MGRGKGIKARVQEAVLKEKGLEPSSSGSLQPKPIPIANKTLAMRLLEIQFGEDIDALIKDGTIADVADYLGIEESTVSKWRLRLGLRTRANRQ